MYKNRIYKYLEKPVKYIFIMWPQSVVLYKDNKCTTNKIRKIPNPTILPLSHPDDPQAFTLFTVRTNTVLSKYRDIQGNYVFSAKI